MFLENILQVIKDELKIDLLKDNSRNRNVVDARRIYADLSKQLNIFSYLEIGKKINRNHASIIHLCRTSNDLKKIDRVYNEKYNIVFDKTIKINTNETIISNYKYYKTKYRKYRDLLKELKDQESSEKIFLNKVS